MNKSIKYLVAIVLSGNELSFANEIIDLDPVEVIAASPSSTSTELNTSTATLSNTPIFELPLSATRLELNDFAGKAIDDIADLADYSPGVSRRANYWGVNTPTFQLRGFNAGDATAYYRDGFRYQGRGPISMANVEAVEILRGPTSALYGWGDPGGAVHVVVKKPTKEEIRQATVQSDRWGKTLANVDVGGSINDNAQYRFVLAHENGDSFRDQQTGKQTLVAPTIAFQLENNQSLELALEWLDDKRATDYGVPAFKGKPANVPVSRTYTESWGEQHSQSTRLSSKWQQPLLGGDFSLGLSFYRFKYLKYRDVEPYAVSGDNVLRTYEDYPEAYRWVTSYVDWSKKLELVGVDHKVATRFEASYEERKLNNGVFDEYPAIDIFNPVYNQAYTPTADFNLFSQSWRNRNYGLVLQDEMTYNDWTWLFGIRYGYIKQNYRLNELLPVVINNKQEQSDTSVMPRIGVSWRTTPSLALYANYSAGNMPTLPQRRSVNGNSFDPISSKQLEAGLKLQDLNNKWLSTLAFFDIELNNGLTRDPANTSFSLQTGNSDQKVLSGLCRVSLPAIGNWFHR